MLSVIISSYNKNDLVKVHARECMNSSYMPDEIIVVNDHGNPDLKDKLKELDFKTRVIYAYIIDDIKWNYTGARNLGVWLSRGNYISIEDDDHIPHKDFYRDALKILDENPEIGRIKTHKRWAIALKDILNKPVEDWKVVVSRPAHQDVDIIRRDVYLKVKGYDERLAGAYGWSATDWRRRLYKAGIKNANVGYQYVVQSPKGRGLSYRNYGIARKQRGMQSPLGILNFQYEYEEIGNKE